MKTITAFIIPSEFEDMFPLEVDCFRVELRRDSDGRLVAPANLLYWQELIDKANQLGLTGEGTPYTALYTAAQTWTPIQVELADDE